jgi:nucleoside-diphosphate-sugar epimerase
MKILVTGSTGFIGKRLSERLVSEGHDVICTGRRLSSLGELLSKAKPLYLDIEDLKSIKNILHKERPVIVFHCAALVSNGSLVKLMRANRDGTKNMLEACLSEGIERVVYLSSIAVVSGNSQIPITDDLPYSASNRYGQSKIEAEKIAMSYREKGLKVSIIRPVMVYGENEPHLLGLICRLIRWRLIPIIGDGKAKLQLVDVDNVVDVMMLALEDEKAYEGTYIVADKEILDVREFFEYIAKCRNAKPPFRVPERFLSTLEKIPFIEKQVSFFIKDRVYSIENIKEKLGYIPHISTYNGLKKAVTSFRDGTQAQQCVLEYRP